MAKADLEAVQVFADALRRMNRRAGEVRKIAAFADPLQPVDPANYLEGAFPVACVALPYLCLDNICRYVRNVNGALPLCLRTMEDGAGTAGGRSVRGACIAWRGCGFLLADEQDSPDEQRFSLMHEGAHFLLDYYLPRLEAIRKVGPKVRDVLDGRREPTYTERFHAVLRGAQLEWHTHLYDRRAAHREQAEYDADALACLLMTPAFDLNTLSEMSTSTLNRLVADASLPGSIAPLYRTSLGVLAAPPKPKTGGLLGRLTR